MASPPKNRLLVEGDEDKRVIPYLIEANGIRWGETRSTAIVDIESYGGIENLDSKVIATEMKASGLSALGMVVDANNDPAGRWRRLRGACLPTIAGLPERLPDSGLVQCCDSGIRFGVWLMPDNRQRGMLETFLGFLVPSEYGIWKWTAELCTEARTRGAAFKDVHRDKARIHAWLAFQDPPGRPLHNAVKERILQPGNANAKYFVQWFCRLFSIEQTAVDQRE